MTSSCNKLVSPLFSGHILLTVLKVLLIMATMQFDEFLMFFYFVLYVRSNLDFIYFQDLFSWQFWKFFWWRQRRQRCAWGSWRAHKSIVRSCAWKPGIGGEISYGNTGHRISSSGCKIRNIFALESTHPKEIVEFWELDYLDWEDVKKCQNLTFKTHFLHQKSSKWFSLFLLIKEYQIEEQIFCYLHFLITSFFKSFYY